MSNHNDFHDDEFDDDIEFVSKSELKRDHKALQKMGEDLIRLSAKQLQKIPLDDALRKEIEFAQTIRAHSARLRQLKRVGKLLGHTETDPIKLALAKLNDTHQQSTDQFHLIEKWRDRIINEQDKAINAFCEEYEHAERQQLRQIARSCAKSPDNVKPKRQLFKTVKSIITGESE